MFNHSKSFLTLELRKILETWHINWTTYTHWWGFPDNSVIKNLPTSAGDMGLIPGMRRSPRKENGNPLQYSFFFFFFKFYFIFKLYKIVLVLPNIKMNPPQVYMCSPSWTLLPPPSPYHPSGSSQCTSPKHPVSCIEPGLATRFIHDIIISKLAKERK